MANSQQEILVCGGMMTRAGLACRRGTNSMNSSTIEARPPPASGARCAFFLIAVPFFGTFLLFRASDGPTASSTEATRASSSVAPGPDARPSRRDPRIPTTSYPWPIRDPPTGAASGELPSHFRTGAVAVFAVPKAERAYRRALGENTRSGTSLEIAVKAE